MGDLGDGAGASGGPGGGGMNPVPIVGVDGSCDCWCCGGGPRTSSWCSCCLILRNSSVYAVW